MRKLDNGFIADDFDHQLNTLVEDTLLGNQFNYDEQIHAVYALYGSSWKKFSYQLGGRLEQAFTTSVLVETNEQFTNDYMSFFPSGFLTYALAKKQSLQLSYSRRISRPRTRHLNPFTDRSDPLNLRFGNPFLKPEYIDAYELNYSVKGKKLTFIPALYFRKATDVIQRVNTIDSANVSTNTYQNFSTSTSGGIELVAIVKIRKWWSVNASFDVFYVDLDGTNVTQDLSNQGYSWQTSLRSNMRLPKGFGLQVNSIYRGRRIQIQGTFDGISQVSLAASKKLLKNRMTLSLRVE